MFKMFNFAIDYRLATNHITVLTDFITMLNAKHVAVQRDFSQLVT